MSNRGNFGTQITRLAFMQSQLARDLNKTIIKKMAISPSH